MHPPITLDAFTAKTLARTVILAIAVALLGTSACLHFLTNTSGSQARANIAVVMFACAMLWGLCLPLTRSLAPVVVLAALLVTLVTLQAVPAMFA